MKPIPRAVLQILGVVIIIAAILLVSAPPRGHSVLLLPAPTPAPLQVHIDGAVQNPGLYSLPPASLLSDAIAAAGGLTDGADSKSVNLAAVLQNNVKYTILEQGETANPVEYPERSIPILTDQFAQLINLNTATAVELELLPGIGPSLAGQIVTYREAYGKFAKIEDILDVPGIGQGKFENMKSLVTVD